MDPEKRLLSIRLKAIEEEGVISDFKPANSIKKFSRLFGNASADYVHLYCHGSMPSFDIIQIDDTAFISSYPLKRSTHSAYHIQVLCHLKDNEGRTIMENGDPVLTPMGKWINKEFADAKADSHEINFKVDAGGTTVS